MKWNILVLGINPFNKHVKYLLSVRHFFFLIVKDEEVIGWSPCIPRDHRFSKQTHSAIRAQSGKQRSTHSVTERVKAMAIFTDRKKVSQEVISKWCLKG